MIHGVLFFSIQKKSLSAYNSTIWWVFIFLFPVLLLYYFISLTFQSIQLQTRTAPLADEMIKVAYSNPAYILNKELYIFSIKTIIAKQRVISTLL